MKDPGRPIALARGLRRASEALARAAEVGQVVPRKISKDAFEQVFCRADGPFGEGLERLFGRLVARNLVDRFLRNRVRWLDRMGTYFIESSHNGIAIADGTISRIADITVTGTVHTTSELVEKGTVTLAPVAERSAKQAGRHAVRIRTGAQVAKAELERLAFSAVEITEILAYADPVGGLGLPAEARMNPDGLRCRGLDLGRIEMGVRAFNEAVEVFVKDVVSNYISPRGGSIVANNRVRDLEREYITRSITSGAGTASSEAMARAEEIKMVLTAVQDYKRGSWGVASDRRKTISLRELLGDYDMYTLYANRLDKAGLKMELSLERIPALVPRAASIVLDRAFRFAEGTVGSLAVR